MEPDGMVANQNSPGTAAPAASPPFVGREHELAALAAGLDAALGGRTQLFLLAGEPGIGKTRLAAEIGAAAAARGALVLWGRCCEDSGAPPFWPWAQVLRAWLEASRALLSGDAEASAGNALLAQIVPELGDGPHGGGTTVQGERRFELFDAVVRRLRRAAAERPLVLLLDDLHAADLASLLLLQFLARHLDDAPLLVVGSYRPADLERSPERADAIAQVARVATRLPLTALGEGAVADLVGATLGPAAAPQLAAAVFRVTEGNPFFVAEMLQLLLAERATRGALPADVARTPLPHGVRALLGERLRPLTPECRELLEAAAVLGRDFDAGTLRAVTGTSAADVAGLLAEAEHAGLVVADGAGGWTFTHGLIRDALQAALAAPALARLHRCAAESLEQLGSDVARIAYHYAQAARFGDWEKAVAFAERAARQAMRQWAWEEAGRLYQQAIDALDLGDAPAVAQRVGLLLAKGRAEHAAGAAATRATLGRAAELARAHGLVEAFAEAVLGLAELGLGILGLQPDESVVALLEEADRLLAASTSRLAPRVRAHLAAHLAFPATEERSLALVAAAERAARDLGDDATLADVLARQHLVLWRFNRIAGRLGIADELIRLAERLGERDLAWLGHAWRVVDCMTLGDAAGVDAGLEVLVARASADRQPRFRWMANNFEAARALWRGRWREAEGFALACLQVGTELADPLAQLSAPTQLFLAWRELGREIDEAELRRAVDRFPESAMIRASLVTVLLDQGRDAEARVEFERIAAADFAGVRRERRLGVLAPLSEACWRLGDATHARTLAALLAPFADTNVMYAATACFGAAARYLGQLAALQGDRDAAQKLFAAAAARNRAMGAVAPLAWTLFDEAKLWRDSDPARARARLEEARALALPLAMGRLLAEIERLGAEPAPPAATVPRSTVRGVFRRQGDTWTVSTGQREIHVVDTKGMGYIAELLRKPGEAIAAIDLGGTGAGPFSPGEALVDRQARDAYRRRLVELKREIDAAGVLHDLGRIEHLQHEAGQLEQELSRVIGLHGRLRRGGNTAERARLNVTRAIRTAIRRIDAGDAGCGRFFAATIRTGNVCQYLPGDDAPSEWAL